MQYPYLKNLNNEQVLTMASLVDIRPGEIVSKTLAQNKAVSLTLFAFDQGEEISTHDSTGDAMVIVLEGVGQFTVNGVDYVLQAGETLVMPAKKPHSVFARQRFKMLLIVVFPFET